MAEFVLGLFFGALTMLVCLALCIAPQDDDYEGW